RKAATVGESTGIGGGAAHRGGAFREGCARGRGANHRGTAAIVSCRLAVHDALPVSLVEVGVGHDVGGTANCRGLGIIHSDGKAATAGESIAFGGVAAQCGGVFREGGAGERTANHSGAAAIVSGCVRVN